MGLVSDSGKSVRSMQDSLRLWIPFRSAVCEGNHLIKKLNTTHFLLLECPDKAVLGWFLRYNI